jgi:hypothetical protein
MKNLELFEEVLEYIKANPEKWDQSKWASIGESVGFCGCFAGHLMHTFQGRPVNIYAKYVIYDNAVMEAFGLSAKEADFLTSKERTIADFAFFIENESVTNPANCRIEDAQGFDKYGHDKNGLGAPGKSEFESV